MKLSIIIINYKSIALILDCIRSVYEFGAADMEIIVADNFSGDDAENMLKQHFPAVRFLQIGYNAGFARANNAAMKIAHGELILLLNPDTIILDNALNRCIDKFSASGYVACGVQLLNPDHTPQISGNYAMKGGLNYLLPLPYMGSFLKAVADLLKVKKPNVPKATGIVEVDWINGAFLMVKKSAIDKAGMLDEDFFLYAEEAEWCSRLKKTGKLCIYGDVNVLHLQGESSADAFNSPGKGYANLYDKKGLQIMVSNMVRIRKEFGVGWFLFDLLFYIFTIPVFFFGLIFFSLVFWNKSKYSFTQWAGFVKNIFTLTALSGRIISNRPYFYKVL